MLLAFAGVEFPSIAEAERKLLGKQCSRDVDCARKMRCHGLALCNNKTGKCDCIGHRYSSADADDAHNNILSSGSQKMSTD